jgi:hypothetical protein
MSNIMVLVTINRRIRLILDIDWMSPNIRGTTQTMNKMVHATIYARVKLVHSLALLRTEIVRASLVRLGTTDI